MSITCIRNGETRFLSYFTDKGVGVLLKTGGNEEGEIMKCREGGGKRRDDEK